jgi:hypothetical protein
MTIDYVEIICSCCDFYKESDEDLECGAFKILRWLIETGKLSLDDINSAKNEVCKD